MADSLHGSARTTPRVRAELQASKDATGILAQRYGLSRTTVNEWRGRTTTADAPMGPTAPHSTVLSLQEEAMAVEFRRLADERGELRQILEALFGRRVENVAVDEAGETPLVLLRQWSRFPHASTLPSLFRSIHDAKPVDYANLVPLRQAQAGTNHCAGVAVAARGQLRLDEGASLAGSARR